MAAPYMCRILAILKHSDINLRVVNSEAGHKMMRLIEQVWWYCMLLPLLLSSYSCAVPITCGCFWQTGYYSAVYRFQKAGSDSEVELRSLYLELRKYIKAKDVHRVKGKLSRSVKSALAEWHMPHYTVRVTLTCKNITNKWKANMLTYKVISHKCHASIYNNALLAT